MDPTNQAKATRTRRTSVTTLVNQSTTLLMISIGALILILALLILLHQNTNATKGYMLRKLERERSQLLLEQEVLRMQVAETQALETLQQDKRIQGMLPIKRPLYVKEQKAVALK